MAEEELSGELQSCEGAIMKLSVSQLCWLIYSVMKTSLIYKDDNIYGFFTTHSIEVG